jgi:hypothetical protein
MYFSNFESYLRYGIILRGGDRARDSIFKLQKCVLRVICGVSSHTSCRQIFKDYNVNIAFAVLTGGDKFY